MGGYYKAWCLHLHHLHMYTLRWRGVHSKRTSQYAFDMSIAHHAPLRAISAGSWQCASTSLRGVPRNTDFSFTVLYLLLALGRHKHWPSKIHTEVFISSHTSYLTYLTYLPPLPPSIQHVYWYLPRRQSSSFVIVSDQSSPWQTQTRVDESLEL